MIAPAPDRWDELAAAWRAVAAAEPLLTPVLQDFSEDAATGLARLLGRVLHPAWLSQAAIIDLARETIQGSPALVSRMLDDLGAIHERNLEAGDAGAVRTWIGNRGFHILAAHRVTHALWTAGRQPLALAVKAAAAPLGADIHPAARFGRRIFLDHGVGLVVGETAAIDDDVSIWHGVTLGSTLMADGDRHPKVGRGAVIGAGATILGNIDVGEGAIVAAGSVVLRPVPPFTVVAGNPAVVKPGYCHPFGFGPEEKS